MNLSLRFWEDGVVVIRECVDAELVGHWRKLWFDHVAPEHRHVGWNPVEVLIDDSMPIELANIYKTPAILDAVEEIFGPNIALYHRRFVVKDQNSLGAVALHQDCGYHRGFMDKLSAFVPLTVCSPQNGALSFVCGTHHFGYLGDAGKINPSLAEGFNRYTPTIFPGDVVLMHSSLWHESGPSAGGTDRVIADIHYQPADDPSGVELLRGEWQTNVRYTPLMREKPFVSSRVSRILELEAQRIAVDHHPV